jgi:hypothetical protein
VTVGGCVEGFGEDVTVFVWLGVGCHGEGDGV